MNELPNSEGSYMSVGSIFRALINFTKKFNRLIMVDIDYDLVLFNRLNLNLIQLLNETYPYNLSAQRFQYIAFIKGFWFNNEKLIELVNSSSHDVFEARKQIHNLVNNLSLITSAQMFEPLPAQFRLFYEQNDIWVKLASKTATLYYEDNLSAPHDHLFTAFSFENPEPYYWENDEQWQNILSALRDYRIHVIQADLMSYDSFVGIIDALKSIDAKISVLDISNVLHYFSSEYPHFNSQTSLNNLTKIIKDLPKTTEAKIWMTKSIYGWPNSIERAVFNIAKLLGTGKVWDYCSFDANRWNFHIN